VRKAGLGKQTRGKSEKHGKIKKSKKQSNENTHKNTIRRNKQKQCRKREVWKEVTTLFRHKEFECKCDNNLKGQEEPSTITG
jgi:hypothetical protein